MLQNPEVNRLLEAAANVLARQIVKVNAVERLGVIDAIAIDDSNRRFVTGKYILAYGTESLVQLYADLVGTETNKHWDGVDCNHAARRLLMGWHDNEDMAAWLKDNYRTVFTTAYAIEDALMDESHWHDQMDAVKLLIVPAVGMTVDDRFLYQAIGLWDNDASRPAVATACFIYSSARLAIPGQHDTAIFRSLYQGKYEIRAFRKHSQQFEDRTLADRMRHSR